MINFQTMKTLNHIAWRFGDEQQEEPCEDENQVEIVALIKADNGLHLTAQELLMNQMANKEPGDHVFFEGTDETPFVSDGVPTYFIGCGS